jgi:hypothetical protein
VIGCVLDNWAVTSAGAGFFSSPPCPVSDARPTCYPMSNGVLLPDYGGWSVKLTIYLYLKPL